jgi:hypothetical protein
LNCCGSVTPARGEVRGCPVLCKRSGCGPRAACVASVTMHTLCSLCCAPPPKKIVCFSVPCPISPSLPHPPPRCSGNRDEQAVQSRTHGPGHHRHSHLWRAGDHVSGTPPSAPQCASAPCAVCTRTASQPWWSTVPARSLCRCGLTTAGARDLGFGAASTARLTCTRLVVCACCVLCACACACVCDLSYL